MTALESVFESIRRNPGKVQEDRAAHSIRGFELIQAYPDSFDWRATNILPPVNLQAGQSCVADSSARLLEALNRLNNRRISIDAAQGHVCTMGLPIHRAVSHVPTALDELKAIGHPAPIVPPFFPGFEQQPADACPIAPRHFRSGDFSRLFNEERAKSWIANRAPILAIMHMQESFLTDYRDFHIYMDDGSDTRGDHAILLIGYGREAGQNYWIAQNSFGSDWGNNGICRIGSGQCALFTDNDHIGYGLLLPGESLDIQV